MDAIQFPCDSCGAELEYHPGTATLKCSYCGNENAIPQLEEPVEELDFHAYLADAAGTADQVEVKTVRCDGCGANSTFDPNVVSDECAFCGSPIVAAASADRVIKPRSILPFQVTHDQARAAFRKWAASRWFAPNDFTRRAGLTGKLNGIYIPYWTYDANTTTRYSGKRGDYYWDTETRTTTDAKGKRVRKKVRVRKTRWKWVRGTVQNRFDDLLILASHSLPRHHTEALEPWDLENLVPYDDQYLSGFRTETYQTDLTGGFEEAKQAMAPAIRSTIKSDIGGDRQRIIDHATSYRDITFKHILLPLWISAYRYRDRTYRFLVNARTGEVQGERPWSTIKIVAAVLVVLIIAAIVAAVLNH